MVKKIKKYAKFIVCVALIMGLIAPSYAALSASDGSAFVTKAEFDSALADFNARLTTFEAGINSKIDSQVTSYLDRNGIWNGKEQVLSDGFAYNTEVATWKWGTIENNWVKFFYDEGSVVDGAKCNTWYHFDKKLVDNINKSGLMHVSFTFNCDSNYKMNEKGFTIGWATGQVHGSWEKQYIGDIIFSTLPQTADVDCIHNIGYLQQVVSQSHFGANSTTVAPFVFPSYVSQAYFFVSKGDKLVFSLAHIIYASDFKRLLTRGSGGSDEYGSKYNLNIKQMRVF